MPEAIAPKGVNRDVSKLTGPSKAAILLLYLGDKVSAEVFRRLSDDQVMRISQEISKLGSIPENVSHAVVMQTYAELVGRSQLQGSMDTAKKLLESAFSPDVARDYIREVSLHSRINVKGLAVLQKSDPLQLSKLLLSEHPQTVALVVSHLKPHQAAKTISLLDDELRTDVCMRLAQLEQISQPIRDQVIGVIADKLDTGAKYESGSCGGVRHVAEIFNHMDRDISQSCLETIEHENPNMALAIRNNMFVFEDLLILGDREMRKIIQNIDKKVLVTALKGTSEDLKEHFFRNMSQRAVEMLKEDMDAMGPIRLKDAEQAQQEIVNTVREMDQSGAIEVGSGGAEEYVS
ncbi:MAG: flagellar motor switch protein FliG [Acidobacteriota bacterium]